MCAIGTENMDFSQILSLSTIISQSSPPQNPSQSLLVLSNMRKDEEVLELRELFICEIQPFVKLYLPPPYLGDSVRALYLC